MQVAQIVANAWYLSGIVSRDLETISGSQSQDGLQMLNFILDEKNMNGRFIPFYTSYTFPGVVGQEAYQIDGLVELETMVVNIGDVRYPMQKTLRRFYKGAGRVDGLQSLPYNYFATRNLDGTLIEVYFEPAQTNMIFTITGRFMLNNVTLTTTISDTLPSYYLNYLQYKLARRLCDWYSYELSDQKMQTLFELEKLVDNVNPQDLTLQIVTCFPDKSPTNWGDVNFGRGWRA